MCLEIPKKNPLSQCIMCYGLFQFFLSFLLQVSLLMSLFSGREKIDCNICLYSAFSPLLFACSTLSCLFYLYSKLSEAEMFSCSVSTASQTTVSHQCSLCWHNNNRLDNYYWSVLLKSHQWHECAKTSSCWDKYLQISQQMPCVCERLR